MDDEELLNQLRALWESCITLGDDHNTEQYKLTKQRVENLRQVSGRIYFSLERHGGTVFGSANAVLHHWVVDPVAGTKWIEGTGRRRLDPPAARLNTSEVVGQMLDAIRDGTDGVIVEMADGRRRVEITQFVPDNGPPQTVRARRKRVRTALNEELSKSGLVVSPRWVIGKVE